MSRTSQYSGWVSALLALLMTAGAAGAADGDKKAKKLDKFWVHPEIAAVPLRSIALLPGVGFDATVPIEKDLDTGWGQASRPLGYRWFYSSLTKDLLRRAFGGDSVLKAVRERVLKDGRIDSLSAISLCRALRTTAVFTLRADQWERTEIEWNQTGKPWTRVDLKAALVDSSGRLLWTASGSETGEGPLQQADAGTLGVKSSGLNLQAVTGEGRGSPPFQEVLARIFSRWVKEFPARPAPAPVSDPAPEAAPAPASGGGN